MDILRWLFLESTAALSVVIALSLFFLLVYWRRTLRVRPLLVGMGISIVLLIVQGVVVTPREHAREILDGVAADLTSGRTDALAAALARTFAAESMHRDEFLALVKRRLTTVQIYTADNSGMTVEDTAGDHFTVRASYVSRVSSAALGQFTLPSAWRFVFVREDGAWKIERIEPITIGLTPMRDWRQVEDLR